MKSCNDSRYKVWRREAGGGMKRMRGCGKRSGVGVLCYDVKDRRIEVQQR